MSPTPLILILGNDEPLSRKLARELADSGNQEPCPILGRAKLETELLSALSEHDTAESRADGPKVAVYLADWRDPRLPGPDLFDAEACFELCASLGIDHLVLISSGAIDEPSAHHPNRISEERRARRRTGNPQPDRWLELERLAAELVGRERLTILRPPIVLVPGGRDFWSRLFGRRCAFTLPGFDPTLQLLSPADLARAIAVVIAEVTADGREASRAGAGKTEAERVYNLTPRRNIPLRAALRRAGILRLPMPGFAQAPIRRLLGLVGLSAPLEQLDYIRYPWTLSGEKARRELGWEALDSSARAIDTFRGKADAGSEARPDLDYDPYGLDTDYIRRLSKVFFRFLHDSWWRIEVRGLEHLPASGPAVLTGVHRGFQPWDGVMAMYLIARERGRHIRFLTHPTLLKFPFLAPYMIKMGGIPAGRESGDWALEKGQIMAIFPEGIRGAFRNYGPDIYRIGKMGRDEYVRFALRHRAPIVPFVTIGSAEIYPIQARLQWSWWQRLSEWPCFPITPTLGTVPLPSKWHTVYLEPIPTVDYPEDAEHDRELVSRLSAEIKERMQATLDDLLARRRHIYWGTIFANEITTEMTDEGESRHAV